MQPAAVTGVDHSMRLMRDETFGPVIPLMPYKDFDEAIRLANDSIYGLGASLMTHDARLVKRFFEGVKAGTIWINDPLTDNFAGPFGGMKMSGLGRELGQEGLDDITRLNTFIGMSRVALRITGIPIPDNSWQSIVFSRS